MTQRSLKVLIDIEVGRKIWNSVDKDVCQRIKIWMTANHDSYDFVRKGTMAR